MHLFVREIQVREAYGLGLEICPWIVELGHCRCSTQNNNNNNTMELRWQRCLHYSCTRNALVVVSAGDSKICVPQIFDSTLSDTDRRKTCLPRLCAFNHMWGLHTNRQQVQQLEFRPGQKPGVLDLYHFANELKTMISTWYFHSLYINSGDVFPRTMSFQLLKSLLFFVPTQGWAWTLWNR